MSVRRITDLVGREPKTEIFHLQIQATGSWQTDGGMEVTVTRRRKIAARDEMFPGDGKMSNLGLEDVELDEVERVVDEVVVEVEQEVEEMVSGTTTDGVNLIVDEIQTVGRQTPEVVEVVIGLEEVKGEAEVEVARTELIISSKTSDGMLTWRETKTPVTGTILRTPNILSPFLLDTNPNKTSATMEVTWPPAMTGQIRWRTTKSGSSSPQCPQPWFHPEK